MELIIIASLFIFLTILIVFILNNKISQLQNQKVDPTILEWIKSTNMTMHQNSVNISHILQENTKQLNDRLDRAAEVMRDVNREVGKMNEIGRNMEELQQFLKNPKIRGNIGEHVLKDMIAQVFPKNTFNLQYAFRSGEKVDAAIRTDAGILPIDAKFPMDNFQKMLKSQTKNEKEDYQKEFMKDVKKHIDAIAKKYILPDEGTMDFALMYVPSEAVFYEIVNLDDIVEYARTKRIYVVSPSTLYAHLQTILLSFEGKKIESKSKEVFQLLRALQIDYQKVDESLDILGKHLTNASSQYMNVSKGFINLGNKLLATKDLDEKASLVE